MAYVKNIWVDQDVERPKTYEVTNNQDGSITLTDSFGLVTELGTPVNEVNMNHIEDGIDGCAIRKHNLTEAFNLGEWVLGGTGDDEGIYKSLIANNTGNALTDTTKWEEVKLGGGGGLEIGDIGIAPLGIDETKNLRRYANGQVIIQDQFASFTTKLKRAVQLYPSLVCTEAHWQATVTLSVGGQCGKFVIDDVAGTIRLPKIIMPIQGLTNLASLAEIVEAGLPNITGEFRTSVFPTEVYSSGAFAYTDFDTTHYGSGNSSKTYTYDINASRSSSIYGNSTTVQQEQIQYPYFIQVATGVEESVDVTREIELNNPFCLLDYKYSEYELDNISWLRSNGQWNAKAVFPDAYDLLLKIYNGTETKAGVSVKLSTETYADTDFVLNTTNETFRLPLKVALASGKAVVGNGLSLGLTDGTINAGLSSRHDNGSSLYETSDAYGTSVGASCTTPTATQLISIGVTTDATNSGLELSDANLYLYFYVGETVQNASLINAGRIEEKLVDKADVDLTNLNNNGTALGASLPMLSDTYDNLTLGATGATYTAPANGWFYIRKSAGSKEKYLNFEKMVDSVTTDGFYLSRTAPTNTTELTHLFPVCKNDSVKINYDATGSTIFRFYYAQGSKWEGV